MMKYLIILSFLLLSLGSCKDNKEANQQVNQEEKIAFEKTEDSIAVVERKMDSLEKTIEETSQEIDALLDDIDDN